nr:twin-arginine translocase subunit TatB [Candidatus Hydrogenedentota bacterium]
MFDMGIGMGEMLLVGVIALIVLGPEKFPDCAKLFIRASRDLRGYLNELKTEIAKEVN